MSDEVEFFFVPDADRQAAVFPTELGWMTCQWSAGALERNAFGLRSFGAARRTLTGEWKTLPPNEAEDGLLALVERLRRFAREFADDFTDVPLSFAGISPFARRALTACRQIPLGTTITYAELARRGGSPGAARAAGNTMARNRFPLIVPCHRVVGAGGQLGGYSAPDGLVMKRRLLAAEARTRGPHAAS